MKLKGVNNGDGLFDYLNVKHHFTNLEIELLVKAVAYVTISESKAAQFGECSGSQLFHIVTEKILTMIANFRSKSLKKLWEDNDERGMNPQHVAKVGRILSALDTSATPEEMNIPGYKLHKLQGYHPPRWSVWVNGNWRITFVFVDGDAIDVDYEDYH